VKGAVKGNYGAVKDPKGAVISAESSREGSAGPGNPVYNLFIAVTSFIAIFLLIVCYV
jgi:hypothetical protein